MIVDSWGGRAFGWHFKVPGFESHFIFLFKQNYNLYNASRLTFKHVNVLTFKKQSNLFNGKLIIYLHNY